MATADLSGGLTIPAPVGGINTVSPAAAMPPMDCISMWNMIPHQHGLRVRSGFREWVTGIAAGVRTLIPFTGSAENGSQDRLFACTQTGIYDVTQQTETLSYTFPLQTIRSGTGVATSFVNVAGEHFIAYCDGSNGYLLYRESTGAWEKIQQGTAAGEVSGVNPGTFRSVMQWKNRLWFTCANSAKAYYLPVNSFAGAAEVLNFAPRFKSGGTLVGLWNWTRDGGSGIDDFLVGISRGGDVVVYQGTDPAFSETFGLKGVYWVGPVPPGRNIASGWGGDLFVISQAGCLPMSRLVDGSSITNPNIYETAKVSNLFSRLMASRGDVEGWAITQHPGDNLLVINVPGLANADAEQLVMSLATKGWSRLSGLPMTCATTWHGKLYFGTGDGRVCINDGYSDDGSEIDFGVLTSFQNLGSQKKKMVHMARPYFVTDGTPPAYGLQARFDYDMNDVPLTDVPAAASVEDAWGVGLWDDAKWTSGTGTSGSYYGTTGMGTVIAIALRGSTKTYTSLASIDIIAEQGGFL